MQTYFCSFLTLASKILNDVFGIAEAKYYDSGGKTDHFTGSSSPAVNIIIIITIIIIIIIIINLLLLLLRARPKAERVHRQLAEIFHTERPGPARPNHDAL